MKSSSVALGVMRQGKEMLDKCDRFCLINGLLSSQLCSSVCVKSMRETDSVESSIGSTD